MAVTVPRSQISPTLVKTGTGSTSPAGGTDDLLTTGNPAKFQPNFSFVQIEHHGSSFTKRTGSPAARFWDITLQFYLQGSGTAGTTAVNGYAAIDALLRAAGMTVTATPATSILYEASTIATLEKCEIHCEYNGLKHTAQNCVGNIVMEGRPNDGILCTWTGRGDYAEPTVASISGFTGGTDRSDPFLDVACTITPNGGSAYTPALGGWRFDRGIQIGQVADANNATGVHSFFIRDARPTMTVDIALDTTGTNLTYAEIYGDLTGQVTHSVTWDVGTSPNNIDFTAAQAELRNIRLGQGDGYYTGSLEYNVTHSTNEDEFALLIS